MIKYVRPTSNKVQVEEPVNRFADEQESESTSVAACTTAPLPACRWVAGQSLERAGLRTASDVRDVSGRACSSNPPVYRVSRAQQLHFRKETTWPAVWGGGSRTSASSAWWPRFFFLSFFDQFSDTLRCQKMEKRRRYSKPAFLHFLFLSLMWKNFTPNEYWTNKPNKNIRKMRTNNSFISSFLFLFF